MEGKNLTQGKLINNMIKLLIPLILINLLNSIYNIIDAVWIGNLIGESGVAVTTNCFPLTLIVSSISTSISFATSVLVAQYYGAKNREKVKSTIGNAYVFSMIAGIGTSIIMIATLPIWLGILNTPVEIFDNTRNYAIAYMLGYIFNFMLLVIMEGLKSIENSKTPLVFVAIGTILNLILDPIFIKCGFGVVGTGYATLIAMLISTIIGIVYVNKKSELLKFDRKYLKLNRIHSLEILKIGFPILIEQILGSIVIMIEVYISNLSGVIGSAAYGVVSKVEQIIIIIGLSFKSLSTIMVGQFAGNGKIKESTRVLKEEFKLVSASIIFISIIVCVVPSQFCRLFVNSEEVIFMAVKFIYAVGIALIIWPIRQIVNGFIIGTGHTLIVSVTAIISSVMEILSIYMLMKLGLENLIALGLGILVYALIELTINTTYLLTKKWQKEVIKRESSINI